MHSIILSENIVEDSILSFLYSSFFVKKYLKLEQIPNIMLSYKSLSYKSSIYPLVARVQCKVGAGGWVVVNSTTITMLEWAKELKAHGSLGIWPCRGLGG